MPIKSIYGAAAATPVPPCPPAGSGVHTWLLSAAHALRKAGLAVDEIIPRLQAEATNCGRRVPAREITSAAHAAFSGGAPQREKLPCGTPMDQAFRRQAVIDAYQAKGAWKDFEDVVGASPEKLYGGPNHATEVMDLLFPGNPWLWMGTDVFANECMPRETRRGREEHAQFLVPSTMIGPRGSSLKSGKTRDNVLEHKYLVVEFDYKTPDGGADWRGKTTLAYCLGLVLPLTMAVHSQGKSLHCWFALAGLPSSAANGFFARALSWGADARGQFPEQTFRMPDGTRYRDDGTKSRQHILYFDPKTLCNHPI